MYVLCSNDFIPSSLVLLLTCLRELVFVKFNGAVKLKVVLSQRSNCACYSDGLKDGCWIAVAITAINVSPKFPLITKFSSVVATEKFIASGVHKYGLAHALLMYVSGTCT